MSELFIKAGLVILVFYGVKILYRLFNVSQIQSNDKIDPNRKILLRRKLRFDDEAITWCAGFLSVNKSELEQILDKIVFKYHRFRIKKRKGGYRSISSPEKDLKAIQRTIYHHILSPEKIHPAATGFRKGISIIRNAQQHVGKSEVLKTDIVNFFSYITQEDVVNAFIKIGYPENIANVLAELCCYNGRLPQGAPSSPALSNIVVFGMDRQLAELSNQQGLTYTRYADDLVFSGNHLNAEIVFPMIKKIVNREGFAVNLKKTRYMNRGKRKIITGISISSEKKLTIPKAKKREIRKNVHFVLTKGLAEHQKFIKSTDPVYLKRLLCYLSFWKMVEPENQYVIKSINALKSRHY